MIGRWLIAIGAASGLAGCYSYVPVTVRVVDAATSEPIKGASVVSSPVTGFLEAVHPQGVVAQTDIYGIVRLQMAPNYGNAIEVSASRYEVAEVYLVRRSDQPQPEFAHIQRPFPQDGQPVDIALKRVAEGTR